MSDEVKLTRWQRTGRRQILKLGGKHQHEPMSAEDWSAYYAMNRTMQPLRTLFRVLPHEPRCRMCGAPFGGLGKYFVSPLGYRPSRKNPELCISCVELSPPGGMNADIGVLFADVRGFTSLSEATPPDQVSALLRRFYGAAERVLLKNAIIDKLIGDEVMALYLPMFVRAGEETYEHMLDDARALLRELGYGTPEGPLLPVGIGLDFGEAYVGNIGDRAMYDFTAIGDVVNTASRLQGEASGGEIVLSARLADRLPELPAGERLELTLKGKAEPFAAYRVAA